MTRRLVVALTCLVLGWIGVLHANPATAASAVASIPACAYAAQHQASAVGLVITERGSPAARDRHAGFGAVDRRSYA